MQCSPAFDCNWDKQNGPTTCLHQLHPRYWVLEQDKCLGYKPDFVDWATKFPNCVGGEGAVPRSNPH